MKLFPTMSRLIVVPSAASLKIMIVVGCGTVVAKAAGLTKELMIAYQLGAGPQLDAFLYSYTFPAFLIAVVVGGLAASFIPRYLATQVDISAHEARRLAGELATIIAVFTVLLAVLATPVLAFLIPMLASGFDDNTSRLAVKLLPVLCPLLALSVFTSLWSSLLNAHRSFAVASFAPVVTPLVVLCALYGQLGSSGALSLAIGTVIGGVIETSILAARTRAAGLELFRLPRLWRPEYGQVLRQFWPAAGGSVLMSGTMLVDQSFAANLSAGSVSALSYGTKLASVFASISIVVVSTLSLPMFSRLAANRDYVRLRRVYYSAGVLTLLVTTPVAAILAVGAEPILRFVFMRGSFSAEDAALAASVQSLHAWHLVPYILSIIAVRALAAIGESWMLLVGAMANLGVDLLVNILMVPRMGVAAIGFAATAMYIVSALILSGGCIISLKKLIGNVR